MADILLHHLETDHPCRCCVSVCQLDKWPVRVAVMYRHAPSVPLSLSLKSFTHSASSLSFCLVFISLMLPILPFFFYLIILRLSSLSSAAINSVLPPSESSNLSVHSIRANQMSGCSQFGSHSVLVIILVVSLFLSPSLLWSLSLTDPP